MLLACDEVTRIHVVVYVVVEYCYYYIVAIVSQLSAAWPALRSLYQLEGLFWLRSTPQIVCVE